MSKNSLYKRRKKIGSILGDNVGMIQGSLVKRHLACGKQGCKCEKGERHGPFYYLTYLESSRHKSLYVPKDKVEKVREGIKAYKKVKEIIAEVADINRRLLRKGG